MPAASPTTRRWLSKDLGTPPRRSEAALEFKNISLKETRRSKLAKHLHPLDLELVAEGLAHVGVIRDQVLVPIGKIIISD